jgi:hypothetical protein
MVCMVRMVRVGGRVCVNNHTARAQHDTLPGIAGTLSSALTSTLLLLAAQPRSSQRCRRPAPAAGVLSGRAPVLRRLAAAAATAAAAAAQPGCVPPAACGAVGRACGTWAAGQDTAAGVSTRSSIAGVAQVQAAGRRIWRRRQARVVCGPDARCALLVHSARPIKVTCSHTRASTAPSVRAAPGGARCRCLLVHPGGAAWRPGLQPPAAQRLPASRCCCHLSLMLPHAAGCRRGGAAQQQLRLAPRGRRSCAAHSAAARCCSACAGRGLGAAQQHRND